MVVCLQNARVHEVWCSDIWEMPHYVHPAILSTHFVRSIVSEYRCLSFAVSKSRVQMSFPQTTDQTQWKALEAAVRKGDVSRASSILHNNPGLAATPGPHALLHNAVDSAGDCTRLLRELLLAGVPPNTQSLATIGALHLAAMKGCCACVKELLDSGADVNLKDIQDRTPLFYAVNNNRGGSGKCIQLLLEKGSSVSEPCEGRITPLHVAAEVGNVTAAQLLLKVGAPHSARDKDGCTPLHLATTTGMVEALLAAGADVTVKDNAHQTPLERVIQFYPKVAQSLLDAGVEMRGNPQEKDLRVFFHLSSVTGGCSPCEVDILDKIAKYGHYDLLKHPLCEMFLHLKWYHVRPLFYVNSFIRIAMILAFSTYLTLHRNFICWRNGNCTDLVIDNYTERGVWIISMRVLAGFLLALAMLGTLVQMLALRLLYLRRASVWLGFIFNLSALSLIIMDCQLAWGHHIGVLALLTGWGQVTFLVCLTPSVGIYMQMFIAVSLRMMKLTVVFLPLFIGFAAVFNLNYECDYFGTPVAAFLKTLAMMVGDVSFNDIFETPIGLFPETRELLYIIYLLLMTITGTNLLIGLAIEDIQVQMAQASASRLALTVQLEMYIDEFFNSLFFTNRLSSSVLHTLKDLTTLLPNLPVKRLIISRSDSWRRSFVDDFIAHGKRAPSRRETNRCYNVFICPNRSKDPGQVYRSLAPNEFSGDDFFERPAGYFIPPWIVRSTKILINSDRFKKKEGMEEEDGREGGGREEGNRGGEEEKQVQEAPNNPSM
ncbi:transient receptor potential channel pyrexia-like [Penaeus japonicus]|uniref:transient receptor potential channel pyrexia-like n=1 Tax=Penaeus japonicus TaxID=27405 RepID=UPI001C711181|nr:transient receptor potential channel pyrexia-like [Penaeus japonicus]